MRMKSTKALELFGLLVAELFLILLCAITLRFQPLIYVVIFIATIFTGYPILWLFRTKGRMRIISAMLLLAVLGGGAIGIYWDELVPDKFIPAHAHAV